MGSERADRWWEPPLRETFAGRRVILAGSVAAAWVRHAELLETLGAEEVLVAATEGRGVGPVPEVPSVVIDAPSGLGMMDRMRWSTRALVEPPDALAGWLDDVDPDRSALVSGSFLNEAPSLGGRPFLAWRRPEWVALEDKVTIDTFWDAAGVRRAPSVVVPVADARSIAPSLDDGAGTVWAGDAREGYHGGGDGTRWVLDDESAERATGELAAVADRVRVMPFLEGIPCSIHGIVLPDGVAVLRPVELIVLRGGSKLIYAGCATFWDPADQLRSEMREVARRVGEQLRADVEFRGAFTVDGVATVHGFRPTELNPRVGAGLITIGRATGCPLVLLNDLVVGGVELGRPAADIEADLLERSDATRDGGTWIPRLPMEIESVGRRAARSADGTWRWLADGDDDATADHPAGRGEVTAQVIGGDRFLRCVYDTASVPIGPPTAPTAASFWAFADEQLSTRLGPLAAAAL